MFCVRDLAKRYICKPAWRDFVAFFSDEASSKKDEVIMKGKETIAIG
jgi:hypothetical protein